MSDSGNVYVNVSGNLTLDMSDSGSIQIKGKPNLN